MSAMQKRMKAVCERSRKPKNIGTKLLFTLAYLAIVLVLVLAGKKCIFLTLFALPCPGCGIVRAMQSVLHLDFAAAFRYNAMFWSVPVLYLYFLFDGNLFRNRTVNKAVFIGIAVGFAIVWIIKLVTILC